MSKHDDLPEETPSKAVALHWDTRNAPRITASGLGVTAEQIVRIAEAHDIPLHADRQLAEALAQIPVGDEIPAELYVAVAEVLAFVFALAGIDPRQQHQERHEQD
ncbi:EscU/YscU/HrcU family type III secretion system export apparatus switch protein [Marichromatium gracile]|uniref:EscU/YscU/HrcU family type III secretion system export apparatus switch protein n=1 Tax=Marichromatium gracile TaxID=1048 RepID=UPI001F22239D|nr:EscU/YscU/HrcU family type III secretion system export apparatus switch protein [Marichromatium gracile]MCF1182929.1 EscU/YscU/HrcU family type III secretion system export apparatus switch protein [Marichromatium gracile]